MNPSRPILFLENLIEISLRQTSFIVLRLIEFERNYRRRRWSSGNCGACHLTLNWGILCLILFMTDSHTMIVNKVMAICNAMSCHQLGNMYFIEGAIVNLVA